MTRIEKIDDSGILYSTTSAGITCYDIFTHAGKYRGGKIYHGDKIVRVLNGSCKIILHQDGRDNEIILTSRESEYLIPAGIPNLFYFEEDCRMLEWFPSGTKTENYERYRAMKK